MEWTYRFRLFKDHRFPFDSIEIFFHTEWEETDANYTIASLDDFSEREFLEWIGHGCYGMHGMLVDANRLSPKELYDALNNNSNRQPYLYTFDGDMPEEEEPEGDAAWQGNEAEESVFESAKGPKKPNPYDTKAAPTKKEIAEVKQQIGQMATGGGPEKTTPFFKSGVGMVSFPKGKRGEPVPPTKDNLKQLLDWWNSFDNANERRKTPFMSGFGVLHIVAKRDWEGEHIEQLKGQKGIEVAKLLVEVVLRGVARNEHGRKLVSHRGYTAILERQAETSNPNLNVLLGQDVWVVSGYRDTNGLYELRKDLILEYAGERSSVADHKATIYAASTGEPSNAGLQSKLGVDYAYAPNAYTCNQQEVGAANSVNQKITLLDSEDKGENMDTEDIYESANKDKQLSLFDDFGKAKGVFESARSHNQGKLFNFEVRPRHIQILESAVGIEDYEKAIRNCKTFDDLKSVFEYIFGLSVDQHETYLERLKAGEFDSQTPQAYANTLEKISVEIGNDKLDTIRPDIERWLAMHRDDIAKDQG